jgi:uncharacterized protein YdaU (DUF1376 family)
MSLHYLPFYTGDYLRHTRHLSLCEHGALFLLLTYAWDMEGPVPLDERKIFGICNARSGDEMEAARRVLNEFFIPMEDGWYNARVMEELEKAKTKYRQRVEAGKASARARATKQSGLAGNGRSTSAQRTYQQSESKPKSVIYSVVERSEDAIGQHVSYHGSEDTQIRVAGHLSLETPRDPAFNSSLSKNAPNGELHPCNEKANTDRVRLTRDWKITEGWVVDATSERPDLTHAQILASSNRFKFKRLGQLVSLAEWLAWIHSEKVEKQPVRSAPVGRDLRPLPRLFQNGRFV